MMADEKTKEGEAPAFVKGPIFVDTTIRDGGQSPGVFFDRPTKMAIVTTLSRIGVREIEVGSPCLGDQEMEDLRVLLSLPVPAELFPWLRPLEVDFEAALRLGFRRAHVSFPTSDVHRESVRGMGRLDMLERIRATILRLGTEGCRVSIGLEDASRASIDYLKEIIDAVRGAGGLRVRYCDTVGRHHPGEMAERIAELSREMLPIEIHCHNDLGMATANTVAAFHAGARYLSTTVTGVGERAGNAVMEEVAFAIACGGKGRSGPEESPIDLPGLAHISRWVYTAIGRTLSPYRPIVGSRIFHHSSGIHVDGVIKDPINYELFSPELVGSKRKIIVTHQTGRAGVRNVLERMGYRPTPEILDRLTPLVREEGWRLRGIVPAQTILNHFMAILESDAGASPEPLEHG
jgi:homocitrate synthase NifV